MNLAAHRRLRFAELITDVLPLQRAAEAVTLLDTHPEQALQVVLSFEEN